MENGCSGRKEREDGEEAGQLVGRRFTCLHDEDDMRADRPDLAHPSQGAQAHLTLHMSQNCWTVATQ